MRKLVLATIVLATWVAPVAFAEECKPLQRYTSIPFQPDEYAQIYLPSRINGFQTHLLLDTGAFWNLLRSDLVDQLHLPTKRSYEIYMIDASGAKIDRITTVPEFALGDLNIKKLEFFVGGSIGGTVESSGGVLGRNMFTKADLEIDNAGKTVSLYSQDHCDGEGVYWSDEAVVLEYKRDATNTSQAGTRIRTKINPEQLDEPVVSAELQGKPVTVLFDTGASMTSMDLEHAERVFGLRPDSPGVVPAGQAYVGSGALVQLYAYTFKELTISGIRFENVPVHLGQFGEDKQIVLGMHEMQHLHMYFAFREGRIYITAADAGTRPPPAK
jgi:predicted aspartyl protease